VSLRSEDESKRPDQRQSVREYKEVGSLKVTVAVGQKRRRFATKFDEVLGTFN
jgi:hypothetical protein